MRRCFNVLTMPRQEDETLLSKTNLKVGGALGLGNARGQPCARLGWMVSSMVVGSRFPSIMAVALVAALLLSGCSSKSKAEASKPTFTAKPGEFNADTCAIEGQVSDEEVNPLAGAQVGIVELSDKKTESDVNGRFSFSLLPPGTYNLAATKAGYRTVVKAVECSAGGKAVVDLQIVRIPDPLKSFHKADVGLKGRIACGFGYAFVKTADACKANHIDESGKNPINVLPEPVPITGAVFELQWTQTSGSGGANLQMGYPHVKAKASDVKQSTNGAFLTGDVVRGRSPLTLRIETIDASDAIYQFTSNTSAIFDVRPAGSDIGADPTNDGSSKLVIGQDFVLNVAFFYLGDPVPAKFTMME